MSNTKIYTNMSEERFNSLLDPAFYQAEGRANTKLVFWLDNGRHNTAYEYLMANDGAMHMLFTRTFGFNKPSSDAFRTMINNLRKGKHPTKPRVEFDSVHILDIGRNDDAVTLLGINSYAIPKRRSAIAKEFEKARDLVFSRFDIVHNSLMAGGIGVLKLGVDDEKGEKKESKGFKTDTLNSPEFMGFFFGAVQKFGKDKAMANIRLRMNGGIEKEFRPLARVPDFNRGSMVDYYLQEGVEFRGETLPSFKISDYGVKSGLDGFECIRFSSGLDANEFDRAIESIISEETDKLRSKLLTELKSLVGEEVCPL